MFGWRDWEKKKTTFLKCKWCIPRTLQFPPALDFWKSCNYLIRKESPRLYFVLGEFLIASFHEMIAPADQFALFLLFLNESKWFTKLSYWDALKSSIDPTPFYHLCKSLTKLWSCSQLNSSGDRNSLPSKHWLSYSFLFEIKISFYGSHPVELYQAGPFSMG